MHQLGTLRLPLLRTQILLQRVERSEFARVSTGDGGVRGRGGGVRSGAFLVPVEEGRHERALEAMDDGEDLEIMGRE